MDFLFSSTSFYNLPLNKDFKFIHKQDYGKIIVATLSLYIYCCIFKFVILGNKKEYYSPNYYTGAETLY